MEKILKARENKINNLSKMMKKDYVYLILKTNTPGEEKRNNISCFLMNYFRNIVSKSFKIKNYRIFSDFDGYYDIYQLVEKDEKIVKKICILIEEDEPLGRYIDLDVYKNSTISLSRSDFGFPNRKCFICDNDAHVCCRNKSHSLNEIEEKIVNDVIEYILQTVTTIVEESIELECELGPKFGLVTLNSSGSHNDMNYELMMKSKEVVAPYIAMMVISGFSNPEDKVFDDIREIGRLCEKRMFQATNGINTHKGLIFGMGFVAASFGVLLKSNGFSSHKLMDIIKYLSRKLENDFLSEHDTFGFLAYKKYGFLGARGEVMKGLPNAFNAIKILDEYNEFSQEALTMALITIIRGLEDTVLLKRSGSLERYNYFKNLVGSIVSYDENEILHLTEECIENNISFGGSADVLAIAIFIKKMKEGFVFYDR